MIPRGKRPQRLGLRKWRHLLGLHHEQPTILLIDEALEVTPEQWRKIMPRLKPGLRIPALFSYYGPRILMDSQ